MPFDPNILLAAAEMMSRTRGQDIQRRLARPSFSRTFGQSFASGLGEAPGRALASLPGEFFQSARQDASFAHEGEMEDIRNPMIEVDPSLFGRPGFPMPPPPDGMMTPPEFAEGDPRGIAPPPVPPEMMRASALRAAMEMNRPRFEREIEEYRHGNEMEQLRAQGENALRLERERNRATVPGAMAGSLGLAMPTGFSPIGGGGFQYPDEVPVDVETLRAATAMRGSDATAENTRALRDIQKGDAESKKSKREADVEAATKRLEYEGRDIELKKERLDLDTRAFEEKVRSNAARERAWKIEGNATTLRAARADATRELMAAEKALNDPNAFMRTPEQTKAAEARVAEIRAYRSALDDRLDTLDRPTETPAQGEAPATETIEEKMKRLRERLAGK